MLKKFAAQIFKYTSKKIDILLTKDTIYLLSAQITPEQVQDVQHRLEFYAPGKKLEVRKCLSWQIALSSCPILVMGLSENMRHLKRFRGGVFDIDPDLNPKASSQYCKLAGYCAETKIDNAEARRRFRSYVEILRKQQLKKAYIFGTGPSLAEAIDQDWSDGYRIVCNTIVRDPELWRHINPHFIVAGDALYHFSYTQFARAFRADLALRLAESQTFFVYPAIFHEIVIRELAEFSDRLIPIPTGVDTKISVDLTQEFSLPRMGNVLPRLLLPLACSMSKDVFLWGFDGRAPNDRLFWSNSAKHNYPELMPELQEAFPAFFSYYVPDENPQKYVASVHGETLENELQAAEEAGWSFTMLHESWTPTLQRRYRPLER